MPSLREAGYTSCEHPRHIVSPEWRTSTLYDWGYRRFPPYQRRTECADCGAVFMFGKWSSGNLDIERRTRR